MNDKSNLKRIFITLACMAFPLTMLTSCFLGTTLQTFAAVFGERLISTASYNYSPKYGAQVEELLHELAAETKESWNEKQNIQREEYALQSGSPDVYQQNDYYAEQADAQDNYYIDRGAGQDDYYIDQSADQQYYQEDYNEQNIEQQYYQDNSHYQQPDDQYLYVQQEGMQAGAEQLPISLDVDILVQRMTDTGRAPPSPIQDGDTLYSVQGDPKAGDKIKLSFRSSCNCYIYIVGIDATGYVTSVFPDPSSNLTNPVMANKNYLFPDGTEWYGLDDYKGVEEIYFIASYNRRLDLERIINNLIEIKRTLPPDFQTIKVASGIPTTRGIVKVNVAAPTRVQASDGSMHTFKPSTFITNSKNADLFITRWFYHQ